MGLLGSLFGKSEQDKFAQRMMDVLRKAGLSAPVRYDRGQFKLSMGGKMPGDFFLTNAYGEYCSPGADREQVLARYATMMLASQVQHEETWDEARPRLMPRVRDRSYLEQVLLMGQVKGSTGKPASRLLVPHLFYGLVVDYPEMTRTVNESQLEEWGTTFEDAYAIALQNLRLRTEGDLKLIHRGLYRSAWEDDYDATRLLLPDIIKRVRVEGDLVAMVPNQNTLLVSGTEEAQGLTRMAELTDEILQQPRPMTGIAVRWSGDRWVPFVPGKDHPAHQPLRRAMLCSLSQEYDGQKELLDALHEKTKQDIFVGSLQVLQSPAGEIVGLATWVDGVTHALLPWAEKIAFVRVEGPGKVTPLGVADWDRVAGVVGGMLEKTPYYPYRYRVRAFPSPAQLAAIGLEELG